MRSIRGVMRRFRWYPLYSFSGRFFIILCRTSLFCTGIILFEGAIALNKYQSSNESNVIKWKKYTVPYNSPTLSTKQFLIWIYNSSTDSVTSVISSKRFPWTSVNNFATFKPISFKPATYNTSQIVSLNEHGYIFGFNNLFQFLTQCQEIIPGGGQFIFPCWFLEANTTTP